MPVSVGMPLHELAWGTSVQKMATPSTGFKWALQPLVLSTETN